MAGTMPMLGAKAARALAAKGLLYEQSSGHYQPNWTISDRGRRWLEDHPEAPGEPKENR